MPKIWLRRGISLALLQQTIDYNYYTLGCDHFWVHRAESAAVPHTREFAKKVAQRDIHE